MENKKKAVVFPSPYGDYGSYQALIITCSFFIISFRPLTGIMVLIENQRKGKALRAVMFPSPYGDYGSYP